jgi:transposase
MYIRQTKTATAADGTSYSTFRLVVTERVGGKVRQRTLLNLGRGFSLPREQWPQLCARIEELRSGQVSLFPASATIEELAQRYAAQLVITTGRPVDSPVQEEGDFQEVDINSLELIMPRSIGVEHVAATALEWLGLPRILEEAGLNGVQRAAAIGSVVARMAEPGSELASWKWLTSRSGLGEILDIDFASMSHMQLYRASDLLVRHREQIEKALFSRITDLFSLSATVTLYDLTNTFFEGKVEGNSQAQRGHSKEKRSDCPLVTLGLVLDCSGFVRRSKVFAGNVVEGSTLETMLAGLQAPEGSLVIMDRGIATQANIDWLVAHQFRYLVVSRERHRQLETEKAEAVSSAANHTIEIQRVEGDGEVRLYCYSEERRDKEEAINTRFADRFEKQLQNIADGLSKPRSTKKRDKVLARIGCLQEKNHGIGQHYEIELQYDATRETVTGLSWKKQPVAGTRMTHPGVYCLRTNELDWTAERLWTTYTMLTDLEAVFRSLKSELGLRPVFHHRQDRAEGHLFITVLAYQAVQIIRHKLRQQGISHSWSNLRRIMAPQQRITATFKQKDGRTLHIRKTTVAEPALKKIYDALGISNSPVGIRKMIHE